MKFSLNIFLFNVAELKVDLCSHEYSKDKIAYRFFIAFKKT